MCFASAAIASLPFNTPSGMTLTAFQIPTSANTATAGSNNGPSLEAASQRANRHFRRKWTNSAKPCRDRRRKLRLRQCSKLPRLACSKGHNREENSQKKRAHHLSVIRPRKLCRFAFLLSRLVYSNAL